MDAEYCKEKIVKQHETIVELRTKVRFLHKRVHMYAFIAFVGWSAFVLAVWHYGAN